MNKPNDVVGRSDGTLYFTDCNPVLEEQGIDVDHGIVYRITPDGEVRAAIPRMVYPNGIALSPDESILYVSDSSYGMYILACDVLPDGSVAHDVNIGLKVDRFIGFELDTFAGLVGAVSRSPLHC